MLSLIMQAAPANGGMAQAMGSFLPILLIGVIFYFLLIRPQNQRMKAHRQMLSEVTRGDTIVTNGGLVGKVKKVTDDELTVDFNGNDMKVVRTMLADVRNKTAPANDTGKKK
ncbi:preprotein translocase subunit YajC [Hellea balneolensis]|uniref:preprotein translocase subunit YajC n=1 Tax=Hellea balneolensis TaxID=287478 RepID=UPI0004159104|nr:preprotein translocase subunit YajC [Hellea balneolensis]